MVNDRLQTPLLRALRNKLSRQPLSAFDNCPANDGLCLSTFNKVLFDLICLLTTHVMVDMKFFYVHTLGNSIIF